MLLLSLIESWILHLDVLKSKPDFKGIDNHLTTSVEVIQNYLFFRIYFFLNYFQVSTLVIEDLTRKCHVSEVRRISQGQHSFAQTEFLPDISAAHFKYPPDLTCCFFSFNTQTTGKMAWIAFTYPVELNSVHNEPAFCTSGNPWIGQRSAKSSGRAREALSRQHSAGHSSSSSRGWLEPVLWLKAVHKHEPFPWAAASAGSCGQASLRPRAPEGRASR